MKYELMVILKPLLPEDIRTGIQKKLEALVKKAKGAMVSQDVWGKRHLAYPITNHNEGYYIVYNLELEPALIDEFEKELKLMGDVLRYLLAKK
ncbi:MAG: 30S ribosomal protein S6 [Candidatus Dojkabacteria bacterium]